MARLDTSGPVWSNGTIPEGTVLGRPVGGGVKPLTPAEVATILSTPSSSTIGNLLTANQASGTGALGDTTGFMNVQNATIASSTAQSWEGARSLAVTCTGAGAATVQTQYPVVPVSPGQVVTACVYSRAGATPRDILVAIQWFDSDGVYITTVASDGPFTNSTSGWTRADHTLVAPATAAYVNMYVQILGPVASEVHYLDGFGLWVGAGGMWAMPGVPITNTGRRVTHPNTDDVLVQAWDSTQGRWQVAHYDSGRRSLSLSNGWTATTAAVRRVGYAVELIFAGLSGASASSGTVLTLDSAFRPPYALAWQIGNTASTFPDKVVTVGTDGTVVVGGTYTNVTAGSLSIRMFTGAAVPTSLPGTLVSSAPYN